MAVVVGNGRWAGYGGGWWGKVVLDNEKRES